MALYIWGDHCYCVGDSGVKRSIVCKKVAALAAQSNEVLSTIGRRANSAPASQYWETYSKIAPGHFYSHALMGVRAYLLRERSCPQVRLSGKGLPKGLQYNDCVIHGGHTRPTSASSSCKSWATSGHTQRSTGGSLWQHLARWPLMSFADPAIDNPWQQT